jgi:hypothetical protein
VTAALGHERGEPVTFKWRVVVTGFKLGSRPQVLRFFDLLPDVEAASVEKGLDQGLKPRRKGVHSTRLPVLHRSDAHSDARCQLLSRQASLSAMAQQQAIEALAARPCVAYPGKVIFPTDNQVTSWASGWGRTSISS